MFIYGRLTAAWLTPTRTTSRSMPVEYFILTGTTFQGSVVGTIDGAPIHELAVDGDGERYRFIGVAPRGSGGRYDVLALKQGEWIVEPGLVYRSEEKSAGAA